MSMQITLLDNANNTKTILAENGSTFEEILHLDDVYDILNESEPSYDPDEVEDYLVSLAGTNVSDSPRLRRALLADEAQDGDTIEFDVEFNMDEEETAEELGVDQTATAATNNGTMSSAVGHVIVRASGGLVSVKLEITPGVTTVYDAIHHAAVKARTGYNDTQLAEATVQVNGAFYNDDAARRAAKLEDGQVVDMNPRVASTKG